MKKLEKLTPDFAECTLSSKEMNLVKGGNVKEGDDTVYTSQTTGWKYPDKEGKNGEIILPF